MPTYQYRCAKCGEQFQLWQSIHDDALKRHPGCGGEVTKVMAPAGIVLKGSGFYRTDSRSGGRKGSSRDKEPAKDGAASNGSGSETKSKDSKDGKAKESKDTSTSKDTKPSKSGGSKSGTSSS